MGDSIQCTTGRGGAEGCRVGETAYSVLLVGAGQRV